MKDISMKYVRAILLLCSVFAFSVSHCQNQNNNQLSDSQLGFQYYRQGDYRKAADVFSRLYQQGRTDYYYTYYLNSLLKIPDYDAAEALINSQIQRNKTNLRYNVDLGYLQSLRGNEDKANKIYQQTIKKLSSDIQQITKLAQAFIEYRLYNYAETVYAEGRKLTKGGYDFRIEMAQLFYYQRNFEKMIDEYLELLKVSDVYLQQVQNYLQQAIYNDVDDSLNDLLCSKLLQKSRENPDLTVYNQLLIWNYIQDKKFDLALPQAQALDRRLNENGHRVVSLARAAAENNDFQTAIDAYQYVVQKGGNQEYAHVAQTEMLEVMYRRIELEIDTKQSDFERLEQAITNALQDMGVNNETIDLVRDLAKLKSIYLGKTADAQFLLEDARTMRSLNKETLAAIDIELADVYLMQGNYADATLTYARVEVNNANSPVGSEAKLRKARLAYFIGNFTWAQAQLDALKASTEKLTANDAAQLSVLIEDNTGWDDESDAAMLIYARANLLHYQHNDTAALAAIDTIINMYATTPIADEAWYLKGEIYRFKNRYNEAVEAYQIVAQQYPDDILADNANYQLATIYQHQFNNSEKAMEHYLKLITDYASSIFVTEARKQYRILRGDKIE
ncbi:MAG: tetratricopeptide repeat protein [Salinivirgaceae bacterium]|nr:tetratricopeptide repeat protein [Salinivirgaceae bacterium]